MKSIIKYTFLSLLFGLIIFQNGITAQDKSGQSGAPAPSNKTETNTAKFEFPQVEGWESGDVTKMPSADLVNYDSEEGGRVTLYFYDSALKGIANDKRAEIFKEELQRAKIGILQMGELGMYQNIKESVKEQTVALGGKSGKVSALHSLLYFSAGDNDLVSEIFIFSHKDHLFKIRASRPKDKEKDNKALEKFLSHLDAVFSK